MNLNAFESLEYDFNQLLYEFAIHARAEDDEKELTIYMKIDAIFLFLYEFDTNLYNCFQDRFKKLCDELLND